MNKSKIKLAILFFGGVALSVVLMVAGVWVPILLPIGGAMLAASLGGALGLWQGVYAKNNTDEREGPSNTNAQREDLTPPTPPNTPEHGQDCHNTYNMQNNLFFIREQAMGHHNELHNVALEQDESHAKLTLV